MRQERSRERSEFKTFTSPMGKSCSHHSPRTALNPRSAQARTSFCNPRIPMKTNLRPKVKWPLLKKILTLVGLFLAQQVFVPNMAMSQIETSCRALFPAQQVRTFSLGKTVFAYTHRLLQRFKKSQPTQPRLVLPTPETIAIENVRVSDFKMIPYESFNLLTKQRDHFQSDVKIGLAIAVLGDKQVIIKSLNFEAKFLEYLNESAVRKEGWPEELGPNDPQNFVREAAWTQRLSDLEIGPQFLGITVNKNGHLAIVTEYIEGLTTKDGNLSVLNPTLKLLSDLQKIRQVLISEGIHPDDLQIHLSHDHAVVVNPLFRPVMYPPLNQEYFYRALKPLEMLIENIQHQLRPK